MDDESTCFDLNKSLSLSSYFLRMWSPNKFLCERCNRLKLFYVLLTVHLGISFVNNQLDAQFFFMYVYF